MSKHAVPLAMICVLHLYCFTASESKWLVGMHIEELHLPSAVSIVDFQCVCDAAVCRYFTKEIAASYLPKRKLLCDALAAVGFKLSVPEGAYYIFTQCVV